VWSASPMPRRRAAWSTSGLVEGAPEEQPEEPALSMHCAALTHSTPRGHATAVGAAAVGPLVSVLTKVDCCWSCGCLASAAFVLCAEWCSCHCPWNWRSTWSWCLNSTTTTAEPMHGASPVVKDYWAVPRVSKRLRRPTWNQRRSWTWRPTSTWTKSAQSAAAAAAAVALRFRFLLGRPSRRIRTSSDHCLPRAMLVAAPSGRCCGAARAPT
jgi:hypothetical protein